MDVGDDLNNIVGERIRNLRLNKKWSLRVLGKRAHLSHAYIGRIEKGETKPSVSSLESLAEALGVDVFDLIADKSKYIKVSDLPNDLQELGSEYLKLVKELKQSNISPDDIRELLKTINRIKKEN